jgi:hypothetical protein
MNRLGEDVNSHLLAPNNRFQGRPPLRGVRPEPKR